MSAYLKGEDGYLIDGVAINGVSGGPVFFRSSEDGQEEFVQLVGIVSAYISNVQGSRVLPGLSKVQDVSPFFATLQKFKNLDDAKKHAAAQPPLPPEQPTEPLTGAMPSTPPK